MSHRTDPDHGLTADEVADRVARGLVNAVPASPTRSVREIVVANVFTPINLVVGVLAALVLVAGSPKDALFAGVIVANSAIGIIQEVRAKRVLDSLRVVTAPHARVIRGGAESSIAVHELVMDDLVALASGAQIVADGDVVLADNLEVDESLLTGEADPVEKAVGDGVLSGSAVVAGTGRMVVTKVGAEGYAAQLAQEARRFSLANSKLREDVNRIVSIVGILIIPIGILLGTSQFLRRDESWQAAVVSTVAGLIGMVPEGLVLLTSVAFAVGVVRLAKARCLVQELPAIEVLARVDVLCADKTGTITEGALALVDVESADGDVGQARDALAAMAASDPDPNATLRAVGAASDGPGGWSMTDRVPFSSARKWSAMSFADRGTWVLGAPDRALGGGAEDELRERVRSLSADGERVLALSRSDRAIAPGSDQLPADLHPAALVRFQDVVREDAPDTLRYFADQGVAVKVISGDDPVTVGAVARRAGLERWESAMDAQDLPGEEDEEGLSDAVDSTAVFGRVTPHQKRAMVRALQRRGHTVAMTGDGVNDVLALKDADCGVAMASGSEATRGVAQLVLLDSNFSALPAVVAEGRRVINNIQRVASLFLSKTTYSLVLSLISGVFALAYPLRPIHLTLLSWLTIGVPATLLALAPNAERVTPGFLRRVLGQAVPAGLVIATATLTVYAIVRAGGVEVDRARTAAVLTAGIVALVNLMLVARPLNTLRIAMVAVMSTAFGLAFVVPWAQDLFALPTAPAWVYTAALVGAGAAAPVLVLAVRAAPGVIDRLDGRVQAWAAARR